VVGVFWVRRMDKTNFSNLFPVNIWTCAQGQKALFKENVQLYLWGVGFSRKIASIISEYSCSKSFPPLSLYRNLCISVCKIWPFYFKNKRKQQKQNLYLFSLSLFFYKKPSPFKQLWFCDVSKWFWFNIRSRRLLVAGNNRRQIILGTRRQSDHQCYTQCSVASGANINCKHASPPFAAICYDFFSDLCLSYSAAAFHHTSCAVVGANNLSNPSTQHLKSSMANTPMSDLTKKPSILYAQLTFEWYLNPSDEASFSLKYWLLLWSPERLTGPGTSCAWVWTACSFVLIQKVFFIAEQTIARRRIGSGASHSAAGRGQVCKAAFETAGIWSDICHRKKQYNIIAIEVM